MKKLHVESLDTNVLVKFIIQDGSDQSKLATDVILNQETSYFVSRTVFFETISVLTNSKFYSISRNQAVKHLSFLLDQINIVCDRPILTLALHNFLDFPSLSFGDCLISAEVSCAGYDPLWTFDQKFAKKSPVAQILRG